MKFFLLCIFCSAFFSSLGQSVKSAYYSEPYRPQFHFTPPIHWTNDPNGLVYNNGEYHLFYQYNPMGNRWGHMSWGHAISTDLIHWQHMPLAIPESDSTMIFSGSCVVDQNNTSGFSKQATQPPMVAIYTGHTIPNPKFPDDYRQAQCIAYSLDNGRTWTKFKDNPVLDIHKKDFRDPKVFWYEPEKKWVMTLVLPIEHKVQFYSSPDLKHWEHMSDFGPAGDTTQIWECPDLFQVPVPGEANKKKWVLIISGQYAMQYFVGEFDGRKFINENPSQKIYRPDYGPDYYAAVTFNNLPASQSPVLLGWANSWRYANDIPTSPWKSAMSIPRSLALKNNNGEWIFTEAPISALQSLREMAFQKSSINISGNIELPIKANQAEIDFEITSPVAGTEGIRLAVGHDHYFEVGYDAGSHQVYIDRTHTSHPQFNSEFDSHSRYSADLVPQNNQLKFVIFIDQSIVEVFVNNGEVALTTQIFPVANESGIELFSMNGPVNFKKVKIWKMHSVWMQ